MYARAPWSQPTPSSHTLPETLPPGGGAHVAGAGMVVVSCSLTTMPWKVCAYAPFSTFTSYVPGSTSRMVNRPSTSVTPGYSTSSVPDGLSHTGANDAHAPTVSSHACPSTIPPTSGG